MDTTSPSKKAVRVDNQENRTVREKNCNITPFIQLSPRLDDKTPSGNRPRDLQRLWMTVRGKDVQLDSHQQCAQGYCKLHKRDGDRIGHDVPSYDRSHIGVEDKRRRGDLEQIGGSGDRHRRDNPHDSGREDDIESMWLRGHQGPDEELQDEGVPEYERREPGYHLGVGYAVQHPWGQGRHCLLRW